MTKKRRRGSGARHANRLNTLRQNYDQAISIGDFERALALASEAYVIAPTPVVLYDRAFCLLRLDRVEEAYPLFKRVANTHSIAFDGLADACGQLGKWDEARAHGGRALQIKDESVKDQPRRPLPAERPPAFNLATPDANIIAFSLFGANPRYCETAIMNVAAAQHLLPGWRCRFYVDDSVPADVLRRLEAAEAQIVVLQQSPLHPTLWRFLVMDDPSVARFLVRDADSLIGQREAVAVQAWLTSGRWFHVMRDYYTHTELILAGMWGGSGGVFKEMAGAMIAFMQTGSYQKSHLDQHFLRAAVWPTARQSVLSHDSQFAFFNNQPFPPQAPVAMDPVHDHIGANIGASSIRGECPYPDGAPLLWSLVAETGQIVCSYKTTVHNGAWTTHLPRPYAEAIHTNRWKVKWQLLSS